MECGLDLLEVVLLFGFLGFSGVSGFPAAVLSAAGASSVFEAAGAACFFELGLALSFLYFFSGLLPPAFSGLAPLVTLSGAYFDSSLAPSGAGVSPEFSAIYFLGLAD